MDDWFSFPYITYKGFRGHYKLINKWISDDLKFSFKDLHSDLICKYKKDSLMNESIDQEMSEVHEPVFIQTEDDLGVESEETRIN